MRTEKGKTASLARTFLRTTDHGLRTQKKRYPGKGEYGLLVDGPQSIVKRKIPGRGDQELNLSN